MNHIIGFDSASRTRIVFGLNVIDRLGELSLEILARRILIVTDRGIVAAGHVDRAIRSLETAGIAAFVFDRVRENPTTCDVEDCLEFARAAGIDCLIGLGGGSSMDTAKGCNFLLTNGGSMTDYWGVGKASKPLLPLIAIPTTAGTGSECQSFALIADENTHQKMACGDSKALARIAILDPTLTVSQPRNVTACTGIDAIAHAVETAVTTKANELSLLYSREAFRRLTGSFVKALERPDYLEARADMLLGSAFAGIAIENSMLGAAHAAANPLTAHYGTVHGQAVGMMLPFVVRYNGAELSAASSYWDLAVSAGLIGRDSTHKEGVDAVAGVVEDALATAAMPRRLADCGVRESDISMLADEAAQQWTAGFNPRHIQASEFEELYLAAWKGTGK